MQLKVVAIAIAVLLPGAAMASCFICDSEVALDPHQAECFLARVADYKAMAESSDMGRTEVAVAPCEEVKRALDSFPTLNEWAQAQKAAGVMRDAYYLDLEAIDCIEAELLERGDKIEPGVRIDLLRDCD